MLVSEGESDVNAVGSGGTPETSSRSASSKAATSPTTVPENDTFSKFLVSSSLVIFSQKDLCPLLKRYLRCLRRS